MKRFPMLAVGGLFAAGVLAGHWVEAPPVWLLTALAATALAAWGHDRGRARWAALMVFLAGWSHLVCSSFPWDARDVRLVFGEEMVEGEAAGQLVESPVFKPFAGRDGTELFSSALMQVSSFQRARGAAERVSGRVLVTLSEPLGEEFFSGARVRVRGVLQRPARAHLPGAFDYRAHLEHRGVYYVLRTRSPADWQLEGGGAPRPPLPARFQAWARRALTQGQPETDDAVKLLWAMLLGWRSGLTDEITATFMKSGTMHLFAISGLHIGLLALVLVAVMRLAGLPWLAARVAVLPLMWFYIAATGWPASAVRAGIMITVWFGAGLCQRPPQPLNTVCAAAFLILLWEPRQLFQAGFQLSFAVVLGLVLWTEPLTRRLASWSRTDSLALPPARGLALGTSSVRGWLARAMAASLTAWLASAPLMAWHFSWMTPVCVLANVLMVPVGSLTVAAGVGSLLTHAWWPALGEIFNHSAWALMTWLTWSSEWFASLPLAHWPVASPSWPWMGAYYAVWLAVALPYLTPRWRAALGGALVVGLLAYGPWTHARHGSTVIVLPLEDGYSILAREPGWAALFDTGRPHPARRHVTPFLHAQGLSRLDALVLTHGDLGQMGGVQVITAEFRPRQILHGPPWYRSPFYREWLQQNRDHASRSVVSAGHQLHGWQVLHPAPEDRFNAADEGALVWRRAGAGGNCLLLSDLSRPGQNQLATRWPPEQLQADILICGLPDTGEPLADGFLRLVRPRLVVVADSLFPATRRAPLSLALRLARQRVVLWRTSECGAVEIEFTPRGWRARAMDGRQATPEQLPGWHPPAAAGETD